MLVAYFGVPMLKMSILIHRFTSMYFVLHCHDIYYPVSKCLHRLPEKREGVNNVAYTTYAQSLTEVTT